MRKGIFSLLLASLFLLALFGAMRVGEVRAQRQLQQGGEVILVF